MSNLQLSFLEVSGPLAAAHPCALKHVGSRFFSVCAAAKLLTNGLQLIDALIVGFCKPLLLGWKTILLWQ